MPTLLNRPIGTGFVNNTTGTRQTATAFTNASHNKTMTTRPAVSAPLPPRGRESAMRVRAQLNSGAGAPSGSPFEDDKVVRAFLVGYGLSMPANGKRLSSPKLEKISAAIGTLMEHGTVAQGVAHACRAGDKLAFKAVMDLASTKVLDVNASPYNGKPLLALVCTAGTDTDANQKSIRKCYSIDERIEILADHNADFGLRDAHGNSFLHLAAKHDAHPEVIYALYDYASSKLKLDGTNANGETALHAGLSAGCSARMVGTLFSLGADLSAKDNAGRTALHVAAAHTRFPNVLDALFEKGAKLHDTCDQGRTALHHAAAHSSNPDIIKLLLSRGADPEAKDNEGNTPQGLYEARKLSWPVMVGAEK